jgi:hypothetical protein
MITECECFSYIVYPQEYVLLWNIYISHLKIYCIILFLVVEFPEIFMHLTLVLGEEFSSQLILHNLKFSVYFSITPFVMKKLYNVVQFQFPVFILIQREETSTQCLQVLVRDRERIQREYKIRNWGNFIKEESTPSRGSVCFWREIATSQDLLGKIYINLQDDIKGADTHVSPMP